MKKFLIAILGPTGVGKTSVSIEIARQFDTEIISADSRQFYIEMKTGTAVPTDAQLESIKHHFVRFLSVKDYYSASLFERDVLGLLDFIYSEKDIAIMAGGSGMYINAVCNGIDDIPDIDPRIREKYNKIFVEEGIESLRIALRLRDPEYYKNVDLRNHKRIIRALEICESTGKPYTTFLTGVKTERNFRVLKIGLELERSDLYTRIDQRVDWMVENGLESEALGLYEYRNLNALKSVGYSEFFNFFEGRTSRDKAVELIKRNTRRYAKRQMTWWSRDKEIKWFHPDNLSDIIEYISGIVRN
jgi:tRNA dimethylallyltransferase